MKEYMEDPDDVEATNAASACLQETPEPPAIFGYFAVLEAASRGGVYWSNVIKDTSAAPVHGSTMVGLQQVRMVEPRFSGPGWAGTDRGSQISIQVSEC